jgi:ribosomal protein S18 acetylase RimI-like enzyme
MRTAESSDVRGSDAAAPHSGPCPDWCILRNAVLESVATSPDAFLTKADEIKGKSRAFWKRKLRSSHWAVVQRGDEVLGIAAAKPPGKIDSYASQGEACFIESVWISPNIRRQGIGERLVNYLIEQKRRDGIRQFYLWVFDQNTPAIELYENMEFKPTDNPSALPGVPEIQYLREFDSALVDDEEAARNEATRADDQEMLKITYRMLTSPANLPGIFSLLGGITGLRPRYWRASVRESRAGRPAR